MIYLPFASHLLFFSACGFIILSGVQQTSAADSNDDDSNDCLPQVADRCFKEVYDKLPCSLKRSVSVDNCPSESEGLNNQFKEFCSALDDSLSCSSDIIDTGCTIENGRVVFDIWMGGLRAVTSYICMNINETLKIMTDNAKCWNSFLFMECVKATTRIEHVVDIMKSNLDLNECILLVFSLAECNLYAGEIPRDEFCSPELPKEMIKELLHVFLSKTNCVNFKLSSIAIKNTSYYSNMYLLLFIVFLLV